MNSPILPHSTRAGLALAALLSISVLHAFPPAPHHLVYGTVRDELGNPLTDTTAEVILETSSGVKITTLLSPTKEVGANYHIGVPMDAGITSELYKPTALRPAVPFKMRVRIGQTSYLPIEMSGDYARLGEPGAKTRLDLTLGEDLDGDGLPDAWERALLAARGGGTLQDINPDDDDDGDGLSNLQEYLAGTYAYDPADGFTLNIVRTEPAGPVLEFLGLRGRTYTILSSPDLIQWTPVRFGVVTAGTVAPPAPNYYARDVRMVQVRAELPAGVSASSFFKLIVQ